MRYRICNLQSKTGVEEWKPCHAGFRRELRQDFVAEVVVKFVGCWEKFINTGGYFGKKVVKQAQLLN